MFILCWSTKGGSGTTVVASVIGVLLGRSEPTTIIDIGGDVPAALGISEPRGPGVNEWLQAPAADGHALVRLGTPVVHELTVVHRGGSQPGGHLEPDSAAPGGWDRIADACVVASQRGHVVVDAGRCEPPPDVHGRADHSLLVIRACYLALRRASIVSSLATAALLVDEPGRALGTADVERALALPVIGELPWDPGVARSVDSGILASRLPSALVRPLRRITDSAVVR